MEIFVLHDTVLTGNYWPKWRHVFYESQTGIVWALAVGFMIFSCAMGKGGFINDILSWTVWIPLSRLSFSAYLIHTFVLIGYLSSQEHFIHLSDVNFVYMYIGHLFLTYIMGYLVSMVFEVPILGLEKFIFPSNVKKSIVTPKESQNSSMTDKRSSTVGPPEEFFSKLETPTKKGVESRF